MRAFLRLSVGLLLIIAVGVALVSRAQTTAPATIPGPNQPCRSVPVTIRAGQAVPTGDLAAIDLISLTDAVAVTSSLVSCLMSDGSGKSQGIGTEALPGWLAVSHDRGRTWTVEGTPLPGDIATQFGRESLTFISDRTGWLLATTSLIGTTDGGLHWRRADLGQPVVNLARSSSGFVALTSGDWKLWTTKDVTSAWHASSPAPIPSRGTSAYLVVNDRLHEDLLVPAVVGNRPFPILSSLDAGRTWRSLPDPCIAAFGSPPVDVTSTPDGSLGALCGGSGAAGSATRGLFVSDDGGTTWSARALDENLAVADRSGIPLEDFGDVLVAPANGEFLLATADHLAESIDGGRQWNDVGDVDLAGNGAGSTFSFVGPMQGWLLAPDTGLWTTVDGVHWHAG